MYRKKIEKILFALQNVSPVNVYKPESFSDEPKPYYFNAYMNLDVDGSRRVVNSSGVSFFSKELALLKCLAELAERSSLFVDSSNLLKKESYKEIKKNAVNPSIFLKREGIEWDKFRWTEGFDLINKKKCLLPAQTVYLNHFYKKDEVYLGQPAISTGAAGEFKLARAIMNGIYEIIERDAFLGVYLNRISTPQVNLKKINRPEIDFFLGLCKKYNLELFTFVSTNDLQIPAFFSLIIDWTNIGMPVAVGARAGLNQEEAIIGSVNEAFFTRIWARNFKINPNSFKRTKTQRFFYSRLSEWSNTRSLNRLDFLLSVKPTDYHIKPFNLDEKEELDDLMKCFKRTNKKVYFSNITPLFIKRVGFHVVKVVIPGLQPMYLGEEKSMDFNFDRLRTISNYFGKKTFDINYTPHPFL